MYLNHRRFQAVEWNIPECRLQINPARGCVGFHRSRFHISQVIRQPNVQPFADRHFFFGFRFGLDGSALGERCRRVVMAFQFCLQSFYLRPYFFLGSGVNALADQFSCRGIDANRDPRFPGTVASFSQISFAISTLQRHRFLLSSTSPAETAARSESSFPL